MDGDIYASSLYGKNKSIPEKIKAYALYRQFSGNPTHYDNFVIASKDRNELSVSFNGGSDCRVFQFDKVLCDVSQVELHDSLAKSIIQDVVKGLNYFLIICNLASPTVARSLENDIPFSQMIFTKNILNELFLYTKVDRNMDSSLHASIFGIQDNRIVDFFGTSCEFKDLKIFKIPGQNGVEIQNLEEKFLVEGSDISELLTNLSHHSLYANVCHSILTVSFVRKKLRCDRFESIKVGKLTVVDFAKCSSNILESNIFEVLDCKLKPSQSSEFPARDKILDILRPAFGGNAKTSIIVPFSSVLYSLDEDLSMLQFVAQAQKLFNHPEVNMKPIIPISLKEYSEEIQELRRDLNAISKGTGNKSAVKINVLQYRSLKNAIALEDEKTKALKSYLVSLTETINSKRLKAIDIHAKTELMKTERRDVEKRTENLKTELGEMAENNVKQKSYIKANEIIEMKELRYVYEYSLKKMESELTKNNRNYGDLMSSLDYLKSDLLSLSSDIDTEQTSMKNTFDLLINDMNKALLEFQTQHEDLLKKFDNLSDIDVLIKSWQEHTESLLSKCSSSIKDHLRNVDSIMSKLRLSLVPLHTSQTKIKEIIQNNRNEKWPVLSYYFHKVQVFCDSSFKILTEILHQLELVRNSYKDELKTISSIIYSSSKTIKKFVSDINDTLKISRQYFEDQGKRLMQVTDLVHFHHKFKKQFDNNFGDIKNSILALKQICLTYNDAALGKWNEIQNDCLKVPQMHADLSENFFVIQKQMSSYTENVSQQKLNAFGYPQLKDKMENVESRIQRLFLIYEKMKTITGVASELNNKGTDKELLEVTEYLNSQKTDIEKYFDNYLLMTKATSSSFLIDTKAIQYLFSGNKDELKKYIEFLSSSVSSLTQIYHNYQSVSSKMLNITDGALKFPPVITDDKNENVLENSSLLLDEWKVSSSTPKVTEKRNMNKAREMEKMINGIKCIAEQQMSEKLKLGDLDSDGKERKNNLTTMSLPILSTNLNPSKVCQKMGKSLKKFTKKQT